MTVKHRLILLCVLINLIVCCVQYEIKSNSKRSTRRLTKLLKLNGTEQFHYQNNKCGNLPPTVLSDVLGAAFNSRYMSIEEPEYLDDDLTEINHHDSTKRNSELIQPFYVDDTFALEISDEPAWEVKHVISEHDRTKRSIGSDDEIATNMASMETDRLIRDVYRGSKKMSIERPWECEAKIKWIDLGTDYFPRFLRSVECTKKKCWYNHYVCKPRSFTVKLLRRRNGECVQTNQLNRITNDKLPEDLKELWVWEERAVNFCCDCVVS